MPNPFTAFTYTPDDMTRFEKDFAEYEQQQKIAMSEQMGLHPSYVHPEVCGSMAGVQITKMPRNPYGKPDPFKYVKPDPVGYYPNPLQESIDRIEKALEMARTNVGQRRHNAAKREDKRSTAPRNVVVLTEKEITILREVKADLKHRGIPFPESADTQSTPPRLARSLRTLIRRAESLHMSCSRYINAAAICNRITHMPAPTWDFICGLWVYEAIKKNEHIIILAQCKQTTPEAMRQRIHDWNVSQLKALPYHINGLRSSLISAIRKEFTAAPLPPNVLPLAGLREAWCYIHELNQRTLDGVLLEPISWMLVHRTMIHPVLMFTVPVLTRMWKEQDIRFNSESYPQGLLRAQTAMEVFRNNDTIVPYALEYLDLFRKIFGSSSINEVSFKQSI